MSVKHQFFTTVATILMVGATTIGVNLSVIHAMGEANDVRFQQVDKRFEQVDKRFEQVDRRFEQMDRRLDLMEARFEKRFERMEARIEALERRVDEGFSEMRTAIARVEGLIQGYHGTPQTTAETPAPQPDRPS